MGAVPRNNRTLMGSGLTSDEILARVNDPTNARLQGGTAQPRTPSPPSTPTTPTTSRPAPSVWNEATFTDYFGRPGTPDELVALESRLGEYGIRVSRNASGIAGKVILPDGTYIDVINASGEGGRGFQWLAPEGYTGSPTTAGTGGQTTGGTPGSTTPGTTGAVTPTPTTPDAIHSDGTAWKRDPRTGRMVQVNNNPNARPPHGTNPNNAVVTGTAVPRGTPPGSLAASNAFAAAFAAQSRQRKQASYGGRGSTMYARFGAGAPLTNPTTLLGR